jgi:hypothetical protein
VRKRIELPDADALFGDARSTGPPPSEVELHQALDRARRRTDTSSSPPQAATAGSRAGTAPARRHAEYLPRASGRARRQPPLRDRLDALEGRLGDLPIDSLLTLREDVEELLAAPDIPTVAVERLLERV